MDTDLQEQRDKNELIWVPSDEETKARNRVLKDYITGQSVLQRSYAQFNNRSLHEAIDDWQKRWNGYIPSASPLLDDYQSRIFLNFTRSQIVSYLSKVALQRPKAKIKAVNKKTGMTDKRLSGVFEDLNKYSLDEENGEARFMDVSLDTTVRGTSITYEGYRREHQTIKIPMKFDPETGKMESKEEQRTIFDNCFQELVPVEDFLILNAFQPDIQKQPAVLWRKITTDYEAEGEYGHYPNWKYVKPGQYAVAIEPTTFYRSETITELQANQVEILRYYNRKKNIHTVVINGIVIYHNSIPFKDGMYPFAKSIFEPFEVPFFWGMGFPQKVMGEQDLQNTFINMMADKSYGSLLPMVLSSDQDDIIEDDTLQVNKVRKVSDINKWRFEQLPGVTSGEQQMFQTVVNMGRENAGDMTGAVGSQTQRGGKVSARQVLLKQQEAMQRLGFSMNFLEDFDRDRTQLRISHILQFYSIPKIEKITGQDGKSLEQLVYREIQLNGVKLSDGQTGTRVLKMVGDEASDPNDQARIAHELSVKEAMGDELGVPTEALAVAVNTFSDYNFSTQVVKNSSYEQNQALEQAQRQEYANWRMELMQKMQYPVNMAELVSWVDESYSIDTDRFAVAPQSQPGQPNQPGQPPSPDQAGNQAPAAPQKSPMAVQPLGAMS